MRSAAVEKFRAGFHLRVFAFLSAAGNTDIGIPADGWRVSPGALAKKGENKVLSPGWRRYPASAFPPGCMPCCSLEARCTPGVRLCWQRVQVPGDSSNAPGLSAAPILGWEALEIETSIKHAGSWASAPLWHAEGAVVSQQGRL